ncbi:class I SAM-dependent methyltransferase [Fictibacillus aquaticus]|nr:class I SAM-dependent methyltransferase [Fictibacillus aquaticus]
MDILLKEQLKQSYDKRVEERDSMMTSDWKSGEIDMFSSFLEDGSAILNLGSGPGQHALYMQGKGLDLTCIDLSENMVQSCKAKHLNAFQMDFYNLDFEKSTFDGVFAMNTLLHVPKDSLVSVLENIKRILKPGGIFYMGVYGGMDSEGVWKDDLYEPKRFFSFFEHEDIKKTVENVFKLIEFKVIPIKGDGPDYQSILLRK